MAYGIAIYNSSGTLIISQDYTNYFVISSGTLAPGSAPPATGAGELLYVRAQTAGTRISGGTSFIGGTLQTVLTTEPGGNIEYVIVKRTPTASGTYGLRVFKSDGVSIAFDSGRGPVKIVSSYARAATSDGLVSLYNASISQPFAVPTGRKRYMTGSFIAAPAGEIFDENENNYLYYHNFITWTSDTQQTIGLDDGFGATGLQGSTITLTIDI